MRTESLDDVLPQRWIAVGANRGISGGVGATKPGIALTTIEDFGPADHIGGGLASSLAMARDPLPALSPQCGGAINLTKVKSPRGLLP
jgi:hypothetical protein